MPSKAIVAVDARKIEVRPITVGDPGPWDVKVELVASAISVGTESYCLSTMTPDRQPYISGYAPIGRIVAVGTNAAETGYKVGERITYFHPTGIEGYGQLCGGHQGVAMVNVDPSSRDLLGKTSCSRDNLKWYHVQQLWHTGR